LVAAGAAVFIRGRARHRRANHEASLSIDTSSFIFKTGAVV
jgi:hypothetical protein